MLNCLNSPNLSVLASYGIDTVMGLSCFRLGRGSSECCTLALVWLCYIVSYVQVVLVGCGVSLLGPVGWNLWHLRVLWSQQGCVSVGLERGIWILRVGRLRMCVCLE